jgi:hypothetical protein
MRIQGPDGQVVDVDVENRLKTFSIAQNEDKHANTEERYWSVFVSITPTGANDKFFYLKNSGTKDLYITDVRISCSAVSQMLYKYVSGTAVGGTEAQVTSRKLGSPKTPDAAILEGADITGLTDIGVIFHEECHTANKMESLKTTSNIIIPQGQAIAFERVAATGDITCVISVSEQEF